MDRREQLVELGITHMVMAKHLHCSKQTVYDILEGRNTTRKWLVMFDDYVERERRKQNRSV